MPIDFSDPIVIVTLVVIGLYLIYKVLKDKIFGPLSGEIERILNKLYSVESIALIAIFDTIAIFDPSQTMLGLAVAPVAGIVIFLSEWGLHDKFSKKTIGKSLIEGLIAAVIVSIPAPLTGWAVVWFGLRGYKKGYKKYRQGGKRK